MDAPIQFATQVAFEAGKVLMESFRQNNSPPNIKPDQSLVTEADLVADRLISRAIHEYEPTAALLSEELNPVLSPQVGSGTWVIDPLDGTTNFSLGLHHWGVSIARLNNGDPETAVLYFPLLNEMFTAQKGEGAYLNGKTIQVKPKKSHDQASFFACCSRAFRQYDIRIPYKTRILGSATYSFCAVARGSAVLGFEARPKIWDIAATWLLVQEAGRFIAPYDQSEPFPLSAGVDYSNRDFPTLAAATRALLDKARLQIQPK